MRRIATSIATSTGPSIGIAVGIVAGTLVAILAVLLIAVRTPDLPADYLVAKYAAPPSKLVDLASGSRAHVRDRGPRAAPVLLLLHGSNSSLHTWEPWTALLRDRLRVIAVDLPGHGLTGPVPGEDYSRTGMRDFVEELRLALGVERWSIAGSSMGGGVARRYALAHPDRVAALILIDASAPQFPGAPERRLPFAYRVAPIPVLNRLLEHVTPRSMVEEGLRTAIHDDALVSPEMVDRYYELLLYPGSRRAARLRFGLGRLHIPLEHLTGLKVPTLVMSGDEDVMTPVESAREMARRIPDARLVTYPGVGHLPMEEAPERSAADAFDFLVSAGATGPVAGSPAP